MRFHVVSLPHTNTTKEFINCAYTEKVRRFCNMMKSLGHTVYLYGGTQNEAEVDELITCLSEQQRLDGLDGKHFVSASLFVYRFAPSALRGREPSALPRSWDCARRRCYRRYQAQQ